MNGIYETDAFRMLQYLGGCVSILAMYLTYIECKKPPRPKVRRFRSAILATAAREDEERRRLNKRRLVLFKG